MVTPYFWWLDEPLAGAGAVFCRVDVLVGEERRQFLARVRLNPLTTPMALIVLVADPATTQHGAFALAELGVGVGGGATVLVHRVELVQLVGKTDPSQRFGLVLGRIVDDSNVASRR